MFWSQSSDLYVLYFHNEPPGNVTNQIREQKGWYTSYYSFSTPGIWKSSKVPTRYKLNLIRCNIKQDFRIQFLYQICSRYVVYDIFCRNTQSSLLQFTRLTLLCTGLMYFVTVSFIIIGHLGSRVMIWKRIARKKCKMVKFILSKKATKIDKIFNVNLTLT